MMTNKINDYLNWRGDLTFFQDPFNEVDALALSMATYVELDRIVSSDLMEQIPFYQAAELLTTHLEEKKYHKTGLIIPEEVITLFLTLAQCNRYKNLRLSGYINHIDEENEKQFAAVTFQNDNGELYIVYRGTDDTIVGWREDFNMAFLDVLPAQKEAALYYREVLRSLKGKVRIMGHSKGGNVAVYAVSQSVPVIRERILEVYNQDGPGFSEAFLDDPGYRQILPILHTQVPQSSVIGMILNRAEPIAIVKSNQSGIMQHDPFSWEVQGNRLVAVDSLSGNSIFLQLTIKNWLLGMDMETRVRMVDMLFDLLTSGDVEVTGDLFQPKNLVACVSRLRSSETIRKYLTEDLTGLFHAAKKARLQMGNRE